MKTSARLGALTALLFLSAASHPASAQVTTVQATKAQAFEQVSPGAPTAPYTYEAFGIVYTNSSTDANSFQLSDVDTINLNPEPGEFIGANSYSSLATLNAAFAAGQSYTFTAKGGTLAGQSDTLAIPSDAYAPLLYLPEPSYTEAQHISPNSDFTFSIASAAVPSGGTGPADQFSFFFGDFSDYYSAGTTSITIPQATIDALTPGKAYFADFNDFGAGPSESFSGDFEGAGVDDFFDTIDYVEFMVAPEPSPTSMLLIGFAVLGVALKLRPRRTA